MSTYDKRDSLKKALDKRRELSIAMAKQGYSDLAICRYFEVKPFWVKKYIAGAKGDEIPADRINTKEEMELLLRERDVHLSYLTFDELVTEGFIDVPKNFQSKNFIWELHCDGFSCEEISEILKNSEKSLSSFRVRRMVLAAKEKYQEKYSDEYVRTLIKKGYNAGDISEYCSISQNAICKIKKSMNAETIGVTEEEWEKLEKEEKSAAKKITNQVKSKNRRALVYQCWMEEKKSHEQTAEALGITRATVISDLKLYCKDNDLDYVALKKQNLKYVRRNKTHSSNVVGKEDVIISMRKQGDCVSKISKELLINENILSSYIASQENNEDGKLYEWKKEIVEKILDAKYDGVAASEVAEAVGVTTQFVGTVRRHKKVQKE